MDLCLPSKRQQRRGGPDLCWQTVPRPRHSGTSSVDVSAERRRRRATGMLYKPMLTNPGDAFRDQWELNPGLTGACPSPEPERMSVTLKRILPITWHCLINSNGNSPSPNPTRYLEGHPKEKLWAQLEQNILLAFLKLETGKI